MKNYCPKIAAKRQVFPRVDHGFSRARYPVLARTKITSVLTERNHVNALSVLAKWLFRKTGKHLKNLSRREAEDYLNERANTVKQKTLDLDRQVLNMHFQFEEKLNYVVSRVFTTRYDRAYTKRQVKYLLTKAPPALNLSMQLAIDAGLRSMELMTIANMSSQLPSNRTWHPSKFVGREMDMSFSVHGKGGLVREVRLNPQLAAMLLAHQRPAAARVSHCGAHLKSHFELIGGNTLCRQFSRLSQKHLGFSYGVHGLRYVFAQTRFLDLICIGHPPGEALKILAQEMGHFAVTNTLVYLHARFDSDEQIVSLAGSSLIS